MNKSALVTGGTRGIGFGIAKKLAQEGYDIILNGQRDADQVIQVVEELQTFGGEVAYIQADISSKEARERLISQIKESFGQLNVLVNNAGVAPKERNSILTATEESYDWVMKVNLKGPYFLTQSIANWMIEQKQSDSEYACCIINVTSVSSTVASTNRGEYCISKAGLSMASQLWAVCLASYDIPVYEVRPGITQTDMTSGVKSKYDTLIEGDLLLQKRWGFPEDVGKAVAMLARGDLPYSTGQVIMVDGGLLIDRL